MTEKGLRDTFVKIPSTCITLYLPLLVIVLETRIMMVTFSMFFCRREYSNTVLYPIILLLDWWAKTFIVESKTFHVFFYTFSHKRRQKAQLNVRRTYITYSKSSSFKKGRAAHSWAYWSVSYSSTFCNTSRYLFCVVAEKGPLTIWEEGAKEVTWMLTFYPTFWKRPLFCKSVIKMCMHRQRATKVVEKIRPLQNPKPPLRFCSKLEGLKCTWHSGCMGHIFHHLVSCSVPQLLRHWI